MIIKARPVRRAAPYCTTREAAERLGVSVRTVQHWAERGVLEVWKTAGGHRRIGLRSLERFIAGEAAARPGAAPVAAFKVVVADADAALLRLYQLRLRAWDPQIEVHAARDGPEALLAVGREQPNLLIVDLGLPGVDGLEMVRMLATHPYGAGLQIIAVGAAPPEARGDLPAAIKVHAKPVPFQLLEREVRAAAAGWRALASDWQDEPSITGGP
ncbi:MAG: excisionase family DNA-binding protein [Burkholderiales bacterium]|nr:excisionase family DNA-binding protein [Burkholderiales bacterium]